MRRQFFEHGELLLFCAAWCAALLGAWTDYHGETRPKVDQRAAAAPTQTMPEADSQ